MFRQRDTVLIKKVIMDKTKGIYQEDLIVGVNYTYDKKYKKVYDIKSLKRRLQEILKSYK
jgi:hypothetical protein